MRIVGLRPCDNSGGIAAPGGSGECLPIMRELEKSRAFVDGEVAVVAGNSPLDVVDVIRRAALCGNRGLEAVLPLSVFPAKNSSPSRGNGAFDWRARALASSFGGSQMNAGEDYGECGRRGEEEEEELRAEDEEEHCCAVVVAAEPGDLLSSSPIAWTLRAPFRTTGGDRMMATATDGLCRGSDSDINRESAANDRISEGEGIGVAGDCRANVGVLKRGLWGSLARNLAWVSAAPVGCRVYYCLEEALWEASRLELEDSQRRGQSSAHEQARALRDVDGKGDAVKDKPPQKLEAGEEGSGRATGSANAGDKVLFAQSEEEILGADVFRGGSETRFRGEFRRSEGSGSDGYSTCTFIIESDNEAAERCVHPRGARLWESVVRKADVPVTEVATGSFVVSDVIDGSRMHFPRPDADDQRRLREEGDSRAGPQGARSEPHADALDILVARVNEPGVSTQQDNSRWGRKSRSTSSPVSVGDTGLGANNASFQQTLWKGCSKEGVGEGEEGRSRRTGDDDLDRPTTTNHGTALLHFVPARVEQLLGTPHCREFVDALPPMARGRVLTRYGDYLNRFPPIGNLYVPLDSPERPEMPRERSGTEEYSNWAGEGEDDPRSESRQEVFGAETDLYGDSSAEVAGDGIGGITSSGSGLQSGPLLGALVHPLPVRAVRELLQIHVATTRSVCAVNVDGEAGVSSRRRSSGLFVPQPTLPRWISFDVGEDASIVDDGGSGCNKEGINAVRKGVTGRWGPGLLNLATTPPSAVDVLPDSPLTPLPHLYTRFNASARVKREEARFGGDAHDGGDTAVRSPGPHTECDGGRRGPRVSARSRGGESRSRDGLDVIYRRHQDVRREGNTVDSSIAASLLTPFCHTYVAVLAPASGGFSGSSGGARGREQEGKARRDPLPEAMTSLLLQVEVETLESAGAREDQKAAKYSDGGGEMHAGVCAWRACVADAVVGCVRVYARDRSSRHFFL